MTAVQEFQKKHGQSWQKIVTSPAFADAMSLLNVEKVNAIIALQDADIEKNSREILADLRGHLAHENSLATLHERRTFDPTDLPPETYESEEAAPTTTGKPKRKKD